MNKALFLDRDGVINKDTSYLHKIENVEFVDGIFDLCKAAINKQYLIIVITNQGGIAMNYYGENDMMQVNAYIKEQFLQNGIKISEIYFCPHHPEGVIEELKLDCDCRKPNPGMFLRAQKDFDIDFSHSIMIGDKESDRILIKELKSYIIKSVYCPQNYDIERLKDIESKI